MDTLLLKEEDLKGLLTMEEDIMVCDRTYADLALGNTVNPTKVVLNLGETQPTKLPYNAFINAMPAYIGWLDIAGMKWIGGFKNGRLKAGKPYINALTILLEPDMGDFLAVMEGTVLSTLRTGAQSAVALKYLMPGKTHGIFGIYGAGRQGRGQARALAAAYHVDKLVVYDPVPGAAEKFKQDMADVIQGEIVVAKDISEPAQTDAFITVTAADDRFLKSEWIEKGTVHLGLGTYTEAEEKVFTDADVLVVDHIGQALHRGNLKAFVDAGVISEKDVTCTVGELAAGQKDLGDLSNKRVSAAIIGLGCLDVASCGLAYKNAIKAGVGQTFRFTEA